MGVGVRELFSGLLQLAQQGPEAVEQRVGLVDGEVPLVNQVATLAAAAIRSRRSAASASETARS